MTKAIAIQVSEYLINNDLTPEITRLGVNSYTVAVTKSDGATTTAVKAIETAFAVVGRVIRVEFV